ncbi:MAG: HAMP domain-containing sensor histidine kinase [Pseudomonadota bacterium]
MKNLSTSVDKNIVDVGKKRSASSKAVREFRTRLNLVGEGSAYEADLLKGFAKNQVNAFFIAPVLVMLAAILAGPWAGWTAIIVWAGLTIAAHMGSSLLAKRYLSKGRDVSKGKHWRRAFILGQVLIALAWVFYATLESGTYSSQFAVIQFSSLLVFVAATSMLNHALGMASLITVLPPTLVFSGRFLSTNETAMMMMGGILLASVIFFHLLARRFQSLIVSMLEHATENETLIAELETEKTFSEGARERAEEANLAKSRFLATMSHELRTPLNAILGFSEIMRDEVFGPLGSDTYKDYVKDIHNSGSHLLKLINEILDISRIEAGKHELNEENLKLVSVVEEARHMMEIKAKQKDITIKTSYHENLPHIWVDERAIRQISLNLLSNALKFTPVGGEITIKVGWTAKGGQYFSIKDSGPGIPEEEIPLVLSSFGQGTIAIKHAEPGTGLGLTIVQALLHMHQGRFSLNSKLREGTEAIAYLPKDRVSKKVNDTPPLETNLDLEDTPNYA